MLGVKHDPIADAVYIDLASKPVSYTKEIDNNRNIDFAYDDTPVGIELLSVSDGVDLSDLPERESVEKAAELLGLKVLA